jgi:hypothetical protein
MAQHHTRQNFSIACIATFLREAPPDTFPVRRHSQIRLWWHIDHELGLEGELQLLLQPDSSRTGVRHLLHSSGTTESTS